MEKCIKCGELSVDYDFNYITVSGQDFRVDVHYCSNCGHHYTTTEQLTEEKKKELSSQIRKMFGMEG